MDSMAKEYGATPNLHNGRAAKGIGPRSEQMQDEDEE